MKTIFVSHLRLVAVGSECEGDLEAQVGKLNLVDLAGSERVALTGATGRRLEGAGAAVSLLL